MQDSIFTKIINKELPCYKIAENNNFIAFLDIVPLKKGHTLVVPKIQVDYIYDLPDKVLSDLFIFSKTIAKKIESVIDCKRVGVAVIGLEVPHCHVHLVPINEISDMNFQNQRIELNKEDFQNIRDKIIESS